MKAVLQRVSRARVTVDENVVGSIGAGLLVFLGVSDADSESQAEGLLEKTVNLRIFDDSDGKMNLSLIETGGSLLVVSQFTLFADARRGRRPSYISAATPEKARDLYEYFIGLARKRIRHVEAGIFQAMMRVELINDGPVTIILDTKELK